MKPPNSVIELNCDLSSAVDHVANLLLILAAFAISTTLASLRSRTRGVLLPSKWSPGLLAAFVGLCGLRRLDDVAGHYMALPRGIRVFDSCCDAGLILIALALLLKLPSLRRFVLSLPTREQYRLDVAAMARKYHEQDSRYAALADRERTIRVRLDELEALIARSCWLRERDDLVGRLRRLLGGLDHPASGRADGSAAR